MDSRNRYRSMTAHGAIRRVAFSLLVVLVTGAGCATSQLPAPSRSVPPDAAELAALADRYVEAANAYNAVYCAFINTLDNPAAPPGQINAEAADLADAAAAFDDALIPLDWPPPLDIRVSAMAAADAREIEVLRRIAAETDPTALDDLLDELFDVWNVGSVATSAVRAGLGLPGVGDCETPPAELIATGWHAG